MINFPHQVVHLLHHIDRTTVTNHNLLKFIVYMRVHSRCCEFCGFGQMYNDIYLSLWYHAEEFHWSKNSLCSTYKSSTPPALVLTDLFTVSVILFFTECHIAGIVEYVVFSYWLLSLCHIILRFLHLFSHGWTVHFLLALRNTPLSECTTLYLSTHLPRDKFW